MHICMYVHMCAYVRMYVCHMFVRYLGCSETAGDLQTDNSWMPCKSMGFNSCRANAEWIVGGQRVVSVCVCVCVLWPIYICMYIHTYIHCNRVWVCVCVYLFTSNYVQYILKTALSVYVYACVSVCVFVCMYICMYLNTQGISCACVCAHLWLLIGFVVQNVDLSIEFNCV